MMEDNQTTFKQFNYNAWECTKCDLAWVLNSNGPTENEMHYCPKCGRKIVEVVPMEDE